MRNPYTVFESTRSFFTNTIQPLKLQDITPAELVRNILTEHIYDALSIPGFADACAAIEQYVGGKKGYKKNKYKYDDRTVQLVQDNWDFALKQWNYEL